MLLVWIQILCRSITELLISLILIITNTALFVAEKPQLDTSRRPDLDTAA